MIWTGSWECAVTGSCATPMTFGSSCAANGRPEGVRERLRRGRRGRAGELKLTGEFLDPARRAGDAAGVRVLLRQPSHESGSGPPQGDQAAERPVAEADPAELELSMAYRSASSTGSHRLDGLRLAEPSACSPGWTDGYVAAWQVRWNDGRHRRQAAQPADTRHLRKEPRRIGRCHQEILAGQASQSSRYPCQTPTGTTSA